MKGNNRIMTNDFLLAVYESELRFPEKEHLASIAKGFGPERLKNGIKRPKIIATQSKNKWEEYHKTNLTFKGAPVFVLTLGDIYDINGLKTERIVSKETLQFLRTGLRLLGSMAYPDLIGKHLLKFIGSNTKYHDIRYPELKKNLKLSKVYAMECSENGCGFALWFNCGKDASQQVFDGKVLYINTYVSVSDPVDDNPTYQVRTSDNYD